MGKATQIKPGEVRNPGGRPKKDYRAIISKRAFELLCEDEPPNGGKLDTSALALSEVILENPKMFQVTSDGAFGKVPQTINLQGELTVASKVEERLKAARKRGTS